jgi:alkylation response protein AidB-like acyl-CoA dehydrogenase
VELSQVAAVAREHAAAGERQGRLAPEVLEALYDAKLFKLWVPRTAGGLEVSVPDALRVFETVAEADGSTGWTVMIGAGAGIFGGFLQREAARAILGGREDVIAGSGAPSGRAMRVDGGLRVSGRWQYASGAPHATWFTANCVIVREERDGQPVIRAVAVPRSQAQVIETWDVTGMRGTGSHDIAFDDVVVPDEHSFSVFDDAPIEQGPLYRFPFTSIAVLSFAPVALGIARRALSEFAALARTKVPSGAAEPLATVSAVEARFAQASALVEAARQLLYGTAERQWRQLESEDRAGHGDVAVAQAAANHAVHASARAVDLLYDVAGMDVLFVSSALGRCWRDLHALTQNRAVSVLRWEEAGGELLEGDFTL